jgi:malonate-semialdehyde dehydrogenase (acetylating)/methylmalonate-semialdehyde dehydrogenase
MLANYIDGRWTPSLSREKTPVLNPATGEKLAETPLGHATDVDMAVDAAERAYASWRCTPVIDRIQPFFQLKALLEKNIEELSASITKEHGKTLAESRGSVRRAIQMVETATSVPSLLMGQYQEDIASGIDSFSVKQPMGVFAGIAPFNFPAMVPFWFWPFAVATGNTFVLKPSERVPLTQNFIFELIEQANFPKGVINLVHGGKVVVDRLCTHPKIKGVSFVGSTAVAKHVYRLATSELKRVQALGGAKNFLVVMPDAIMDKAAATALDSIIGCAGERCLAGSVVISIGDKAADAIEKKIVEFAAKVKIGNGLDPQTDMGPLISQAAKDRVNGLIQSALDEGAKILLDGRKDVDHMPGFFLRPTVLSGVTANMRIAKEEIFGPVVCLASAASMDESIAWINSCNYANTASLFTTNGGAARRFTYEVHPSMIGINIGVPAPMAFFSFGGSKDSFFGDIKVHGAASINFYTDTKVAIQRWMSDSSIW